MSRKIRFGIWLPTFAYHDNTTEPMNLLREFIARCEDYGLDIWVIDHLLMAPGLYGATWMEPLSVLAHAGALTRKNIKLATGILVMPVRSPVLLAKEIGTLQVLTDNRFVLGIGPGWNAREFEVTGSDISERGSRTDEMMEALDVLLTQDHASYRGKYYSFEDVTIVPRPNRMPEVWVAGGARVPDPTKDENIHDPDYIHPTVVRRIVKYGRWLSRCSGTQEWLKRDWELVKSESRKLGKDPAQLVFGHCNFCYFTPFRNREDAHQVQQKYYERAMGTRRAWDHLQECYFTGTISDQIQRLEDLVEHGLEYMVFGPLSSELWQLDVIGKEFVPRFS